MNGIYGRSKEDIEMKIPQFWRVTINKWKKKHSKNLENE